MWKSGLGIGIAAALMLCAVPCRAQSPARVELRTYAQQSAPKYYQDEAGAMRGICLDILQAVDAVSDDLAITGHERFMPFKRLQQRLEEGRIDVFFGFAKNSKRLEKFRFLDHPLYEVNLRVAVRADSGFKAQDLDGFLTELDGGRVLTLHATATARLLREQGFYVYDDIPTMESLVKMLLQGRGVAAFYHDLGLLHVIRTLGLEEEIRILPVSFRAYHHYVAFSKDVPDEVVARVDAALDKLERDGTLAAIRARYF